MNTIIKSEGEIDKLLKRHRKEFYPHLKSWAAYYIEMARQRAERDFNKKDQGES